MAVSFSFGPRSSTRIDNLLPEVAGQSPFQRIHFEERVASVDRLCTVSLVIMDFKLGGIPFQVIPFPCGIQYTCDHRFQISCWRSLPDSGETATHLAAKHSWVRSSAHVVMIALPRLENSRPMALFLGVLGFHYVFMHSLH